MKRFNPFCVMVALFALIIAACSKDDNKVDNKPENPKELILEKTSLTLKVAETATLTVTSGNGSYTVKVADQAVASATVTQNTLKIAAIAQGETVVTVADAKGKTASLSVKVTNPLKVDKTTVTLEGTSVEEIAISSGNPDYVLQSSNEDVVKATIIGKESKAIRLQGVAQGVATLTLTDSENQTVIISVTVNAEEISDLFEIDEYGVAIELLATPKGAVKFPAKATSITDELLYSQKEITSIDFNKVTEIGSSAIAGTSNLKSINLRGVKEIGDSAFTASGLTELTLPATVETIGRMAFMNNYSLTKVTVLNPTPITISLNTFATSAQNREKRILYVPKGSKTAYENNENWAKNFKEIRELN